MQRELSEVFILRFRYGSEHSMRLRIAAGMVFLLTLVSARQAPKEYQIKAVFLYNFTQFISWPAETPGQDEPFVIGVAGPNPFGNYLEETVKGETVQGHPIVIKYFAQITTVEPCHILFINLTDKSAIKTLTEQAATNHTLTVGDVMNVEKQGGMIRFVTENNKTRLRINLSAAKSADLVISSKLLKLAEVIE